MDTKPIKLSPAMKNIINLLRDGWELGHSCTITGRAWIQKNGIGNGGESKDVHASTFQGLYSRQLITTNGKQFPSQKYQLTDLGKTIAI